MQFDPETNTLYCHIFISSLFQDLTKLQNVKAGQVFLAHPEYIHTGLSIYDSYIQIRQHQHMKL